MFGMSGKGGCRHSQLPRVATEHVVELGLLACATLQNDREGEIIAVFRRSIYVRFDDRLICVGSRALGSGPLHVLCDRWPEDRFSVGQSVTVAGHGLDFDGVRLADLDAARIWKPDPAPAWSLTCLTNGLQAADRIWNEMSGDDGLAPLGRLSPIKPSRLIEAARPGVEALVKQVERGGQGSTVEVADSASIIDLIGMGPGLTPSGDDFLLGGLLALDALGAAGGRNILWELCRLHLDRTNEISRAHLEAAALGYGAAALHDAIHATMAGRVDRIAHALSAVSEIGQTSGRDGFTGALLVMHAVRRRLAETER
jgi:hypothetical protein